MTLAERRKLGLTLLPRPCRRFISRTNRWSFDNFLGVTQHAVTLKMLDVLPPKTGACLLPLFWPWQRGNYIPGPQSKRWSTDITQTVISQYLYTINQSCLLRQNCPIIQNVFYKIMNTVALHNISFSSAWVDFLYFMPIIRIQLEKKKIPQCQNTFRKSIMDDGQGCLARCAKEIKV